MHQIWKIGLCALMLLSSGCSISASEISEQNDVDVTTVYGTVKSVTGSEVLITYEDSDQFTTTAVPDSATVLRDNNTISSEDLQENENIIVSLTNGTIRCIQVLPE